MMKDAYIVNAVRTPIGSYGGILAPVRADDLAALVIRKLVERNPDVDPATIEDVFLGCTNQAGEDNRNVARMALLLAGLPYTVAGETLNRLCASGMAAVINASRAIKVGDGNLYIAGGVESMTRAPWVISKVSKPYGIDAEMHNSSIGWRFVNPKMKDLFGIEGMGQTAENLAEQHHISREDQDKFAYTSQMKATEAQKNGRLAKEIIPVEIPQRKGDPVIAAHDEFIKPKTNIETLEKLKPAFRKNGSVTAGNSSGINDGAAAMFIASEEAVKTHSFTPIARIVSSAVVGVEPRIMGIGPVGASKKALKKAGLAMKDMDVIELNEAFAAQSLACIRELGLADNDPRINPNGGAIALGHPLGMSGARLLQTAALELSGQHKRHALVTMCVGIGQGYAVVLEGV